MIKKANFIERSILNTVSFMKAATLYEKYAVRRGFLQWLDPRIKTITCLLFLLTAVSLESAALVGGIYLLCLVLTVSSNVPIVFFLLRTWIFIPLFSLGIAIPALFSVVTPGEPIYAFFIFHLKLIITRPGLDGAILFVARIATSVSLVVLLSLTTRQADVLKVMRIFRIPPIMVLILSMCYRYLFLLASMVENIFTAIKSRVGAVIPPQRGRRITAWNMATLWNRAYQMNENVYLAMLSRGYTGEPRLLSTFHTGFKDWTWMLASIVLCAGLFYLEHLG